MPSETRFAQSHARGTLVEPRGQVSRNGRSHALRGRQSGSGLCRWAIGMVPWVVLCVLSGCHSTTSGPLRGGEGCRSLPAQDNGTLRSPSVPSDGGSVSVAHLEDEAHGKNRPGRPSAGEPQSGPPWHFPPSPLTESILESCGNAPPEVEADTRYVLVCLDSLPSDALWMERGRRLRVEWWLVRLLEAHAAKRIDDAKLERSVQAIVEYVEGVGRDMAREGRAFSPQYVKPIPGVDYGDGHFGDDFSPRPAPDSK